MNYRASLISGSCPSIRMVMWTSTFGPHSNPNLMLDGLPNHFKILNYNRWNKPSERMVITLHH